jgi:hypothetical protein
MINMVNEKQWWEYLDWSMMKRTFYQLPKDKQELILDKGTWTKGKGVFEDEVR